MTTFDSWEAAVHPPEVSNQNFCLIKQFVFFAKKEKGRSCEPIFHIGVIELFNLL